MKKYYLWGNGFDTWTIDLWSEPQRSKGEEDKRVQKNDERPLQPSQYV